MSAPSAPVRVLVNATGVRPGGGMTYLLEQLSALEEVAPQIRPEVLVAPHNAEHFSSRLRSPTRMARSLPAGLRWAWEQTVLPVMARRYDVLYCPGNFSPLVGAGTPVLVTQQNANLFGHGRAMPHNRALPRRFRALMAARSVRSADAVVVISGALAEEIRRDLGSGVEFSLIPSGRPEWPVEASEPPQHPPPGGYLLSVANDAPHKRLDLLVSSWRVAFGGAGPPLVLVGQIGPERRRQLLRLAGGEPGLHLVGSVSDRAELKWWVANARAVVSPSVLEALPLTLAEVGSLGTPQILADIPPHREVAADAPEAAVRFLAPDDGDELAGAMRSVVEGASECTTWLYPVTWEANALALAGVLESLAETRHGDS